MQPRAAALAASFLLIFAGEAKAQRAAGPRVEVQLPAQADLATQGPLVTAPGMLSERRVQEALRNGFPARLRFRVELWRAEGWFNSLERRTEWEIIVRREPLEERYAVFRRAMNGDVEPSSLHGSLGAAEQAVALGIRAPIAAMPRGRFYYNVVCEVEMVSASDLDELERWLRGELRPAVRGERNPGTALTRGVRTLMVRLLGGERRRYETRSATFTVP
ncbi:MAG TPA: hypothetical protein VMM18_13855 [Gemmatimonadaceae bacterium]|nr:hypothetical protein [Gemmatimonadaceae bacterium]